MNNIIVFENVSKKYGEKNIFCKQSFKLKKGVTFLVGRNGSGKSTLIKLATGIEKPNNGNIMLFDNNVNDITIANKRKIGLQLQNDAFLRGIKVKEYLELYTEIFKRDAKQRYSVEYIYNLLNLKDIENNYAYALSGGEKKKLSLLLAIIGNKELIILDEPTAGVDVEVKDKIVAVIEYLKSKGIDILISSHDLDDFFEISENILLIDRKIIYEGIKEDFLKKYNYLHKVNSDSEIIDDNIISGKIFTSRFLYSHDKEVLKKYFPKEKIQCTNLKDLYQIAIQMEESINEK